MNQYQIIIREFLEKIVLERQILDDFDFENLDLSEFCDNFELGNSFFELVERQDFPFEKWRDEFFAAYLRECREDELERLELEDDYYRMIGAK